MSTKNSDATFFFRSVGARGMLSAPRRSEEIWKDFAVWGAKPPRNFFMFSLTLSKNFALIWAFKIWIIYTIVVFHHVNPVMDPGIFGAGLASAMALVDHDPTTTATRARTLLFFQQPSVLEVVLASEKLQYNPPKDWRFRTHNLKVPPFGQSLKNPCVVVCRDFEIFKVPSVLWCVRTLSI